MSKPEADKEWVNLTPEEHAARSRALANVLANLDELEEEASEARKAFASRRRALLEEKRELYIAVRTGGEMRSTQQSLFDERFGEPGVRAAVRETRRALDAAQKAGVTSVKVSVGDGPKHELLPQKAAKTLGKKKPADGATP